MSRGRLLARHGVRYSMSIRLCELDAARLVAFRAQPMVLRQERAVDARNGISDGFAHARIVLVGTEKRRSFKRCADHLRRVAKSRI